MDRIKENENYVAGATVRASSAYVPPLQLTKGQPPPIAANGGLSYMSFDRDGDAGTAAATAAALKLGCRGTRAGDHRHARHGASRPDPDQSGESAFAPTPRSAWNIFAPTTSSPPRGRGATAALHHFRGATPTRSVSSNSLWRDPARAAEAAGLRKEEQDVGRRGLYFPQVLRDGRRIAEYYPGLSPSSPECMDKLGVSLAHLESKCRNFYDAEEVERVYYPEIEKLLLDFFPGATDALVYNHDVFDKDYKGDRTEDQEKKNPGVNASYANIVHNDLNDNSGQRCRELLTKNLRNFGREQHYTPAQADAKMSRRFVSINLAKPMETVGQYPFVLCAWPSFADQPYITNYRIYDDRVGETTRFTYRPNHEWYWFPQQKPTEVSMLKCYDSVTDGSVSRWSFHSACTDPTAPADAPCRKNVVVRSFIFF